MKKTIIISVILIVLGVSFYLIKQNQNDQGKISEIRYKHLDRWGELSVLCDKG